MIQLCIFAAFKCHMFLKFWVSWWPEPCPEPQCAAGEEEEEEAAAALLSDCSWATLQLWAPKAKSHVPPRFGSLCSIKGSKNLLHYKFGEVRILIFLYDTCVLPRATVVSIYSNYNNFENCWLLHFFEGVKTLLEAMGFCVSSMEENIWGFGVFFFGFLFYFFFMRFDDKRWYITYIIFVVKTSIWPLISTTNGKCLYRNL